MDGERGTDRSGAAGSEVDDLRRRSDQIRTLVAEAVAHDDGTPDDLRHLVGMRSIVGELGRLVDRAERTSWVLLPRYFYDPEDPGIPTIRAALARGVDSRLVTRPATVRTHPLLPSILPNTLLGPAFLGAMLVDERFLVVEGVDTVEGDRTAWATTRRELVEGVRDLWRCTVPHCAPILPPGQRPPLSQRQLEVARLLAVGEKDKAIARLLGTSARTVERDVSALLRELGASSRTEAVLCMRGRGVNGGWLP